MAKEKPTDQGLQALIDKRSHFRARLEHVDGLEKQKDSPGWPHLKAILEEYAALSDKAKDNLVEFGEDLDDHELRRRVSAKQAERDAWRYVVKLVDHSEAEAQKLREAIKKADVDIEDKRKELAAFGLAETPA